VATEPEHRHADTLLVLIPVYNDWDAVALVLAELDRVLARRPEVVHVLLVDDGSTDSWQPAQLSRAFARIARVDVLVLRRNLGHQRAIAIGLAYADARLAGRAVVVMDGDGEDAPADVTRLLDRAAEHGWDRIVFAARTRRSEGLAFRIFYSLYRWGHRVLTGIPVQVGNFSVVPFPLIHRLVVVSELWNHYAASVYVSRLPIDMIPTERAPRVLGASKMHFTDLAIHGLSAISVFSDRVGVRLAVAATAMLAALGAALAVVVALKVGTSMAIPGWATYTSGLLVIVMLQVVTTLVLFVFGVLGDRTRARVLPARDHVDFVHALVPAHPVHGE
jgi:hypothetical protein